MSNEAGIEYVGTSADGVSLGKSGGLASVYGKAPVAQAATIAAETSAVTTTKFNLVLTALKDFGILASA